MRRIQHPISRPRGLGGVLGIQVMGMIEWGTKIPKPKKILRASNKTPQSLWTKN